MSVVIETTIGDITVDLYLKERPNTCLNFLKLCKIKYYNLCVFYKIEKNFIAQVGDPTATGRGGESIFCHLYGDQAKYFDAEFKPRLKHEKLGTLSMVNNGNNMNGSQFFLTLSENLTYLDENHTVFGEVVEGYDILLKLNDAICDNNSRPYQDIRITHTVILHDPFDDPNGLDIPDASPEPTKEMLESNYLRADEEIDDNKGKTVEEVEEKIKESEAKARATILEMVGDIPDAEVKPPENVLFVCKLNPVTSSDDLEVIFSRFGKILSCEVIKDNKTGESLQYAFIEFEKEEDCEAAYFKMDNVLIDDRRIHVDFSQSVSKMNLEKGKMKSSKSVKSNISLKKTDKIDGYDLIFDMEDDNSEKNRSHKVKSKDSASKYEEFRKKDKYSFPSEKKGRNSKNERYSYDRSYKNTTYDEYWSNKDKSSSYREHEYVSSRDKSRDSDQNDKFKHRNSLQSASRSYRDSEFHRKSSESHSKQYGSPGKKPRYDSRSPDNQRKLGNRYREKSSYNVHSSTAKHFDKSDHREYSKENKKNKSYRNSEKDRREMSLHKLKRDEPKKVCSSKKWKKAKMSSSSSSSSSSNDSDTSSSSSSSSSDYNHKEKSCHQKEEFANSRSKIKSQKKNKYST